MKSVVIVSALGAANAQIHFEIPMGGMGGMFGMGGGQQQKQKAAPAWPTDVDPKLDPDFNWLVGTEWKSAKGAEYRFNRDGSLFTESKKECHKRDDFCKWTANRGEVMMLMPKGGRKNIQTSNHQW